MQCTSHSVPNVPVMSPYVARRHNWKAQKAKIYSLRTPKYKTFAVLYFTMRTKAKEKKFAFERPAKERPQHYQALRLKGSGTPALLNDPKRLGNDKAKQHGSQENPRLVCKTLNHVCRDFVYLTKILPSRLITPIKEKPERNRVL